MAAPILIPLSTLRITKFRGTKPRKLSDFVTSATSIDHSISGARRPLFLFLFLIMYRAISVLTISNNINKYELLT
ncbi:unnamed protein product [Prunus brigantina]